jgi:hypothetical protein
MGGRLNREELFREASRGGELSREASRGEYREE